MSRFHFWQQWLFYSSLLFACFGILFALYGNNYFFKNYNDAIALRFFGTQEFTPQAEQFRAFIWAPLGGTIASSYILLAYIAYYPFSKKERWAYFAVCAAFGTWIIIDSAACFYYKVYFQVYMINAFSLAVKLLPLVFTWKYFFRKNYSMNV